MRDLSQAMTYMLVDVGGAFREMGVSDWTRSRGPGAWTRLEILGHLIDSAVNNHQRIVRAMAEGDLTWPGYDQTAMVAVQQYGRATPPLLIGLWESLNHFLARLLTLIPAHRLSAFCTIGGDAPVTLEALIVSYVAHMQHHLRQIFEGVSFPIRWVEFD